MFTTLDVYDHKMVSIRLIDSQLLTPDEKIEGKIIAIDTFGVHIEYADKRLETIALRAIARIKEI